MKERILEVIFVSISIMMAFALGFIVSWQFLTKTLSEEDWKTCEQIARDAYEHRSNVIVETEEGFEVEIDATTITVKPHKFFRRGKVVARLNEGKLVTERNQETAFAIFCAICIGTVFSLTIICVLLRKKR